MEDFLRRIKLIDTFSTTLNVSRSKFTSALRNNVDEADIDGLLSGAFEAFSSSDNIFTGSVNQNGFKIRKRKRAFESTFIKATAEGKLIEKGGALEIDVQINTSNNHMILFFGVLTIFFFMAFSLLIIRAFFLDNEFSTIIKIVPIVGIFILALFMFGIPYLIMKNGVQHIKQDLEREFHFIISKSNTLK
ncbi:hypothetical protein [uncultured Winogradskyella sp.]|uniref:hypothetical protein n=1 Tax=uncultured Winogradskyella sp. TaxID=395353 RepID=UPI0030EE1760|tara:strand:- start:13826 stop:14395 length:570 start_codon:yes stop_codon:yes gene_type:complete